eukprot:355617-Chlamydomonas_euryale.AAC.13
MAAESWCSLIATIVDKDSFLRLAGRWSCKLRAKFSLLSIAQMLALRVSLVRHPLLCCPCDKALQVFVLQGWGRKTGWKDRMDDFSGSSTEAALSAWRDSVERI